MNKAPPTIEPERPEQKLVKQLCEVLRGYLKPEQVKEAERAYRFAAKAHVGQYRVSGEPYICHPLSVALVLTEIKMDLAGIIAALLHDVLEDTPVSKAELVENFGENVAELVDGVSKLTHIQFQSKAEAQAESLRKMFLAMASDLRVIMIKLADRLHNMRTLGVMKPVKQRRIADETLDIYAPLANRLGMNAIRLELEDLGFKARYPVRRRVLEEAVKRARGNRKELVSKIEVGIKTRLLNAGLDCRVVGREKHLYSIYRKMVRNHLRFSEVFDVYAFRIITDRVDSCYRALGIVHNLYSPIPGKFKDYIALPKANGYQSLHTILKGPHGVPIEIQMRSKEMHGMAETGIAAHWLYKSGAQETQVRAHEWLKSLLDSHDESSGSMEFIENLKVDLTPKEVYLFSPKGDIIKVPMGSTAVDFAYAVHTDVGNRCVAAKVNKRVVPLNTRLKNGDAVEIITASWARPNPAWLNYVFSNKARAGIRTYLKNFKEKEAIELGQRLLEKELNVLGETFEGVAGERVDALLDELRIPSLNQLLTEIGLGNRMALLTARRLMHKEGDVGIKLESTGDLDVDSPLVIRGTEGMVVNLANCCKPIPGDHIMGLFNPGKGVVVHHQSCRNVIESKKSNPNWLEVVWATKTEGQFMVEIRVEVLNKRGALANIASAISVTGSNIENITMDDHDGHTSTDFIRLTVRDRVHLANVIRKLRSLPVVLKIARSIS
jgi:RelA/SpoT family (p)ppGpp synthetase